MHTPQLPGTRRRAWTRPHPWRDLAEAWRGARFRHLVRRLNEQIRIDLSETPQAYTVLAALPGAHQGDITVALEGNVVRISSAARAEHAQHDTASVLRRERYVGRRERTLTLPQAIDAGQASAEYRHGILKLVLPKAGAPRGTLVPVR